jgi:hypothetical protein
VNIEVLKRVLKEAQRDERHNTNAETRYWCSQYKAIAERAIAALEAQSAQQEPVAIVDANDEGYWAEILPDRSVQVGQLLYTSPLASKPLTDKEKNT